MSIKWTTDCDHAVLEIGKTKDVLKNGWDSVARNINEKYATNFNGFACKQRYNMLEREKERK